jgi:hypothetical protein
MTVRPPRLHPRRLSERESDITDMDQILAELLFRGYKWQRPARQRARNVGSRCPSDAALESSHRGAPRLPARPGVGPQPGRATSGSSVVLSLGPAPGTDNAMDPSPRSRPGGRQGLEVRNGVGWYPASRATDGAGAFTSSGARSMSNTPVTTLDLRRRHRESPAAGWRTEGDDIYWR